MGNGAMITLIGKVVMKDYQVVEEPKPFHLLLDGTGQMIY